MVAEVRCLHTRESNFMCYSTQNEHTKLPLSFSFLISKLILCSLSFFAVSLKALPAKTVLKIILLCNFLDVLQEGVHIYIQHCCLRKN